MPLRVFELYSGIGGMHFALKESLIDGYVVRAIDISTTANVVYKENFPETKLLEKNIQGLTDSDFNKLDIDMILMSPPCQPHTRNGLKKDKLDQRSDSLLHIINLIPKLKTVKYILLENVKGFENSETRNDLIQVLCDSDYIFQEFLLSPVQFSIPNSRLRYYLLAKKKPLQFCFDSKNCILEKLPKLRSDVQSVILNLNSKYCKLCPEDSCFEIELILEKKNGGTVIPQNILQKYGSLLDIVTSKSRKSCCFTKGYGHFVEGTGSVLSLKSPDFTEKVLEELKNLSKESEKMLDLLNSLNLRYFTAKEISKLMCFPESLTFPSNLTEKQKFRLLGNSINIHIVGILIRILVS